MMLLLLLLTIIVVWAENTAVPHLIWVEIVSSNEALGNLHFSNMLVLQVSP